MVARILSLNRLNNKHKRHLFLFLFFFKKENIVPTYIFVFVLSMENNLLFMYFLDLNLYSVI